VLALHEQALTVLRDHQVDATVGAGTSTLRHRITQAAVVLTDVALVLIRVETTDLFGAVEAASIENSTNDSGDAVEGDHAGQQPEDPRQENEQDSCEQAVGRKMTH